MLGKHKWVRGAFTSLALVAGVVTPAVGLGQEPVSRVTGVVVAEPGAQPIPYALVRLASGHRTHTDERGAFVLDSVPNGDSWIAAVVPGCRVGFSSVTSPEPGEVTVRVEVPPGELEDRRGVADGALVGLSRNELRRRNFRSVYDALRAIAPYMVGHQSGNVGGSRSLANGSTTTFGSSEPLILLDGIRLTNASVASLEDFEVDDLERIEVARGPTAAWRYGIGGANGAVIMTTIRATAALETDLAACLISFPEPEAR